MPLIRLDNLMKYPIILAILVISTFAMPSNVSVGQSISAPDVDKKLHRKCLYPTVMIFEPGGSMGSGVIVRSDKIGNKEWCNIVVTAAHVVEGYEAGYAATVQYEDWSRIKEGSGTLHPMCVCALDEKRDIAITMFLSEHKMPTAGWGFDHKLYIGNEVIGVGCAFSDFPRVDFGRITGLGKRFLRTSVQTIPGDSGGPVYHKYGLVAIKSRIRKMEHSGSIHLLFHVALQVPVQQFKEWDKEENGSLSYAWNAKKRLPVLPRLRLAVRGFKKSDPFLLQFLKILQEQDTSAAPSQKLSKVAGLPLP